MKSKEDIKDAKAIADRQAHYYLTEMDDSKSEKEMQKLRVERRVALEIAHILGWVLEEEQG